MQNRGPRSLDISIACLLLAFFGCDGLKGCAGRSVEYSLENTNQILERVENSLGDEEDKAQKPVDADFVVEGEKVFYKGRLLPVLGGYPLRLDF